MLIDKGAPKRSPVRCKSDDRGALYKPLLSKLCYPEPHPEWTPKSAVGTLEGFHQNAASRLKAVLLGSRGRAGGKGGSSSLTAARSLTSSTALMVMGDVKMASELLAEAPLASAEEDFSDFNCNKLIVDDDSNVTRTDNARRSAGICGGNNEALLGFEDSNLGAFSASLEDLVSSFDEKITKCLRDYDQTTEQIAPVQVRSQEEIMKTDQVWWTLTGNYGNIMPIDWSKSYARKMQLDALNINEQYNDCHTLRHSVDSSDEEDLDRDLDLHSLILSSLQSEPPNVQSADEVIQQIEDIMAESCSSDDGIASGETTPVNTPDRSEVPDVKDNSLRAQIAGLIRSDHIKSLSVAELVEVHSALEREIQTLSETLVAELAQRDELDFEKETKNTFISLLLTVQNKRRQFTIDRKRGRGHTIVNGEPKYLTTVIPYNPAVGAKVSVSELQILIKILHAINDDSPTVPTLLTDYILKVLCPT